MTNKERPPRAKANVIKQLAKYHKVEAGLIINVVRYNPSLLKTQSSIVGKIVILTALITLTSSPLWIPIYLILLDLVLDCLSLLIYLYKLNAQLARHSSLPGDSAHDLHSDAVDFSLYPYGEEAH